ncbi:hypothetical protein T492DRAFT_201501 [Pavlovales sp. CCMP2436]|nr:hypothetical protein T492DRAFT_201501 [Pavlovales sp. CCMP2436]
MRRPAGASCGHRTSRTARVYPHAGANPLPAAASPPIGNADAGSGSARRCPLWSVEQSGRPHTRCGSFSWLQVGHMYECVTSCGPRCMSCPARRMRMRDLETRFLGTAKRNAPSSSGSHERSDESAPPNGAGAPRGSSRASPPNLNPRPMDAAIVDRRERSDTQKGGTMARYFRMPSLERLKN